MDVNDHSLTLGLITGNKQSYLLLYKVFYKDLCRYACKFVNNPHVAEDIVQETFLKIWRLRKNINPDLRLAAYLHKSVRNNSIDYIKNENREKQVKEVLSNRRWSLINDHEMLEKENELYNRLHKAIDSIPGKSKEVFKMSKIKGIKHKEIAVQLNITVKGVEYHISRALKCVTKEITNYSRTL